jgi:hypothetical protein
MNAEAACVRKAAFGPFSVTTTVRSSTTSVDEMVTKSLAVSIALSGLP